MPVACEQPFAAINSLPPGHFCLADALMKKAFSSPSFNSNAFLTRLLVHMGLLKVRLRGREDTRDGLGHACPPTPSHP